MLTILAWMIFIPAAIWNVVRKLFMEDTNDH